ncbi:GGDEF domain-containing protein [Agarivorans sp.]|uniref:GGDEF domain-containing protein n=1 Tax=Agarivorans sp. TaxID=1872412 RepID=UPI003CFDFB38
MKLSPRFSWLRNVLLIATVLGLFTVFWAPVKRLQLYPQDHMLVDAFSDHGQGGNSNVYWETDQQFICDLQSSHLLDKYCGLSIKFFDPNQAPAADKYTKLRNINISEYEQVILYANLEGPDSELRFFIRSTPSTNGRDLSHAKYMFTYFEKKELGEHPAAAGLNQFTIPLWWLDNNYRSRDDFVEDFSLIKEIGVDIPSGSPDGEYIITLNKIEVEGKWISNESLYAIIIAVWLVYFTAELFRYFLHQRQLFTQSINTLEQSVDQLKHSASNDHLTGVLNRRGLIEAFNERPELNDNYYLFVFDIDHFKQINDHYGHSNGDAVLRFFARQLSATTRNQDLFGRWGGEEFVLLSQQRHDADAYSFAERLRKLINQQDFLLSYQGRQYNIKLSMSIGLTSIAKGEDFTTALNRADLALYQAKNAGRNRSQLQN